MYSYSYSSMLMRIAHWGLHESQKTMQKVRDQRSMEIYVEDETQLL